MLEILAQNLTAPCLKVDAGLNQRSVHMQLLLQLLLEGNKQYKIILQYFYTSRRAFNSASLDRALLGRSQNTEKRQRDLVFLNPYTKNKSLYYG